MCELRHLCVARWYADENRRTREPENQDRAPAGSTENRRTETGHPLGEQSTITGTGLMTGDMRPINGRSVKECYDSPTR